MKEALVVLDEALQTTHGLKPRGVDYEFLLNVHDEFQIETLPQHAELIGRCIVDSIKQAGLNLGIRCPLDGAYKIGKNWKDTH